MQEWRQPRVAARCPGRISPSQPLDWGQTWASMGSEMAVAGHPLGAPSIARSSARRLLRSIPVVALVPVWLLALAVFWLPIRQWWDIPFWLFAAFHLSTSGDDVLAAVADSAGDAHARGPPANGRAGADSASRRGGALPSSCVSARSATRWPSCRQTSSTPLPAVEACSSSRRMRSTRCLATR